MFVALVIQHTNGIRRIILSSVSCPVIFFSDYLIKARLSVKKVVEHQVYVLIFSTSSVGDISHSKN